MIADDDPPDARSALRGLVSALSNAQALLRSSRVGPKSIVAVLPEIKAACELALEATAGGVSPALSAYVAETVAPLSAAVGAAARAHVDARARLALEAAVERAGPLLDAARTLCELSQAIEADIAVEVDVSSLLDEALEPASHRTGPWEPAAKVLLAPLAGSISLCLRPRVAIALLHAAVASVRDTGAAYVRLAVEEDPEGIHVVATGGAAALGDEVATGYALSPPRLVAPSMAVFDAARSGDSPSGITLGCRVGSPSAARVSLGSRRSAE